VLEHLGDTILPDLVAQEAFGRERHRSEDGLNSTGRSSHYVGDIGGE
jgi:hypothetical protein